MAYRHRFYVVKKTKSFGIGETENLRYACVLARFDLERNDNLKKKLDAANLPVTDSFIYMDDGDTPLIEDDYGDKFKEIPLIDMCYIIINTYVNSHEHNDIFEKAMYDSFYNYLINLNKYNKESKALKDVVVLHCGI